MKERQPKPLTKREMLKKLGEETPYEQMHDMVFGFPPMEVEEAEEKKEENDQN